VEAAESNPRPIRPNSKAILTISGVTALNVAFVGMVFLLMDLLKSRHARATPSPLVQMSA
jgi:hypothetical protein